MGGFLKGGFHKASTRVIIPSRVILRLAIASDETIIRQAVLR